jgi:protein AFG1
MGASGVFVRSIATSASALSRERQPRLSFPARIIAGQRRALATVQNGILILNVGTAS